MARRGVLFFIIWIICAAVAFGQSDDDAVWQEVLEQWAEQNDSETVPDDYLEQLQYFAESPINLNDTSSDLLQEQDRKRADAAINLLEKCIAMRVLDSVLPVRVEVSDKIVYGPHLHLMP